MNGKRTLFGLVAALAIVGAFILSSAAEDAGDLAAARAPAAGDPSAEGITVHGHWTLEVFDADGSYVRGVEFENALVPSGAATLARTLGRDMTPGAWTVRIFGDPQPCLSSTGSAAPCSMTEKPDTQGLDEIFDNLTIDVSTPEELTLAGTATIAQSTSISQVRTEVTQCASSVAPDDAIGCPSGPVPAFTLKTTDEAGFDAVPVEAGQLVQVFVTLSFS